MKTRTTTTSPSTTLGSMGIASFKELEKHLKKKSTMTDREKAQLDRLHEYLVNGNGAWALGQELLDEQDEVLKLLCNLCSHVPGCEWLLYISEWQEDGGGRQVCSNAKVTVRAAVCGLQCGRRLAQEFGAALVFNLTMREMFDDAAKQLTEAITQFLKSDVSEEQAYRCLAALYRLLRVSYNEVSAKVRNISPYLQNLAGSSERVKSLVTQIRNKVSAPTTVPKK
ncbi:hypothetical protein MRX96_033041 [Rhipicephalus microplus]